MLTPINARALANGAQANLNANLVDANRYRALIEDSVAFARAAKAMYLRGETDIAKEIHAEYRKARTDAEQLARLIGIEE